MRITGDFQTSSIPELHKEAIEISRQVYQICDQEVKDSSQDNQSPDSEVPAPIYTIRLLTITMVPE